jgi:hypothetical protein
METLFHNIITANFNFFRYALFVKSYGWIADNIHWLEKMETPAWNKGYTEFYLKYALIFR